MRYMLRENQMGQLLLWKGLNLQAVLVEQWWRPVCSLQSPAATVLPMPCALCTCLYKSLCTAGFGCVGLDEVGHGWDTPEGTAWRQETPEVWLLLEVLCRKTAACLWLEEVISAPSMCLPYPVDAKKHGKDDPEPHVKGCFETKS